MQNSLFANYMSTLFGTVTRTAYSKPTPARRYKARVRVRGDKLAARAAAGTIGLARLR